MKLFINSILLLLLSSFSLQAQEAVVDSIDSIAKKDSPVVDTNKVKKKDLHLQYFRLGLDVSKIVRSTLTDDYTTFEALAEVIYKNKMHLVAEGGYANAVNDGANISFTSNSVFLRAGFDKYFFGKQYKEDLDNAFIGLRIGAAAYKRQEAQVTLWDPFYGNTTLIEPAASNLFYWIGINAGFRVELMNNVFIGWNLRGKTFLNAKKICELTPNYLAGYGLAKKQPGLDYNLYLLYGFGNRIPKKK